MGLVACGWLAAACSKEESKEPDPGAEWALVPPEPQDLPRAHFVAPAPELEPIYAARDAAVAGWESESFQSLGGGRLKGLLSLWKAGSPPDAAELEKWTTPDAQFAQLRPAEWLERERNDAALTVLRLRSGASVPPPPSAGTGAAGLRAALDPLRAAFDAPAPWSVLVKVVGVELGPEQAFLSVLAQIRGLKEGRIVEQQNRWRVGFGLRGEEPPLLQSIALVDFEETLGSTSGTYFGEISTAALGATQAWREQLMVPLDAWAGRIDRSLGMSLIGHEGLAVGDVDGDGADDLYVCQPAGLPNLLFVRKPDGTAEERGAPAGVNVLDGSRSALLLDLDNDGDQDLVLDADPRLLLFKNDGSARFEPAASLHSPATTSIAAADHDLDGDLDLYVCGYVLPDEDSTTPLPYHDAQNGRPNRLWRNDGDFRFVDATDATGLDHNNRRFSLAAVWEDFDDDGDPDLYVANDFGRNNLYRNDGGRFEDIAAPAGVEDMAAGMGITWLDHDRDGDLDLYVGNMFSSAGERVTYQGRFMPGEAEATVAAFQRHARGNSLFENRGAEGFRDVSEAARVTVGRWAWGVLATDLDGDGWRDLFVPNGFVTGDDPEDL